MKLRIITFLCLVVTFFYGCSSGRYVTLDELQRGTTKRDITCVITKPWDLKRKTVLLPKSSTLIFKNGGCIKNGTLVGNSTMIKCENPFIGEKVTIKKCRIIGQGVIRDKDVYLTVKHTQNEIQTLFDIGGGAKLVFSNGNYQNVEKIEISNNVEADFCSSTINLKYDKEHVGECFYMEPWVNKHIEYVKIKNLTINGKRDGIKGTVARRCIQLFYVSEVELDNIAIDKFYAGPQEYKDDSSDLLNKTRIGTSSINIIYYDKCVINNCKTNDISNEIFWCVPNNNPHNITYFTNNKSTCSKANGSSSFFTILDGRCVVKCNEVHNYNGSAFNVLCYDSEISDNTFYDGKRSVAIDLSEGTMYRAKNVNIHDNYCYNTKGMVAAFGEGIRIHHNHWSNDDVQDGKRIYICYIKTRGKRIKDGKYVGCNNNPEKGVGSKSIIIENNECINKGGVKGEEIRFACLYGDNISVTQNSIRGLNVPVVQLAKGNDFKYENNIIKASKEGRYAELVINQGKNIKVTNNFFSRVYTNKKTNYIVQLLAPEGQLTCKGNRLGNNINGNKYIIVPCYIENSSKLRESDIQIYSE